MLRKQHREQILEEIKQRIEERLHEAMPGVEMAFQGRIKSIHGIYRKMYVQGKDFDEKSSWVQAFVMLSSDGALSDSRAPRRIDSRNACTRTQAADQRTDASATRH